MIDSSNLASVVVCYFPDVQELMRLIETLSMASGLVVAVDNGGLETSRAALHARFPSLSIIAPGTNIGIAAALNLAFRAANERGFSHVISFDQDSVIEAGAIRALCAEFETIRNGGTKIAAIGPAFHDPRMTDQRKTGGKESPEEARVRPYLITSGCLASVEAWRVSGGFDERLFIDLVDVEWCWRLGRLGYTVHQSGTSSMAHRLSDGMKRMLGVTFNTYAPIRRYYLARNSVYLLVSAKCTGAQVKHLLKSLAFCTAATLFADKEKIKGLWFVALGIAHGCRKRMGPLKSDD